MNAIMTFCTPTEAGFLPRAALEVLAAGRALATQSGGRVWTAILGSEVTGCGEMAVHHGADETFLVGHPRLHHQEAEADVVLAAALNLVRRLNPDVLLFPHDDLWGSNVAPRLAHRLGTGIVTDCIGFEAREEGIRWLRPVYGGKALAYVIARGKPSLATVRSRAFDPLPADPARSGSVHTLSLDDEALPAPAVRVVGRTQAEFEGVTLDQAQVIVSGGRGIEDKENFAVLEELATVLGAAVGGTRPAADAGWITHAQLVGQTGKIVAPNLYIAVGISGAPQHMAGAGSSKTIVALNKDEDAPIFKVAHIGLVDEWQNVLPPLIELLRKSAGAVE